MNISNNQYEVILLEYVVQSGLQRGPIFVHWKVSHTHTGTNADGSFTLSVCLLCCQTFKYLHPKAWAKVNKVPSKTSHFPCHLLKTGGPKTHRHPRSLTLSFFFLFLQQSKHVHAPKLQSLPMSEMQQLVEIHWLFRGPKLGTTLKCRLPLRFLIVHRFYASCHHIPLTLSHFNLSPPKIHCYKKDFHAMDKYGGLCRCPKKKKKQMWLMHSFVHVSLMCQTFNLLVVVLPQ